MNIKIDRYIVKKAISKGCKTVADLENFLKRQPILQKSSIKQ